MAMIKAKSQARKKQRIIKKIISIIKDKKALFITMSFNDETLQNTSAETRRLYIKHFLKSETALYIANIDYGEKNNREHYHAIARATTIKRKLEPSFNDIKYMLNFKAYKYGNIKAEFIGARYGFTDSKAIKKTATDLYEHAIKETTRNNKIIFSRKAPSESAQIERIRRLYLSRPNRQSEQDIMNDVLEGYEPPKETEYTHFLERFKKGYFN